MMKYKKILLSSHKYLQLAEVERQAVQLFDILLGKNIPVMGFIYDPKIGLWMISGEEEIDALHHQLDFAPCQAFDFENYISQLEGDAVFWGVDLSDGDVKLVRYERSSSSQGSSLSSI